AHTRSAQTIAAEVSLVEALGSETIVHSHTASGQQYLIVISGQKNVEKGAEIHLAFNHAELHFFGADDVRLATG
ncbi:MAG: TOBE domain-containing protein, partial [Alphaproteobacteria bacterium]|nr:TOBE domain-containing protein [Alphaproteobacteria bacterium]